MTGAASLVRVGWRAGLGALVAAAACSNGGDAAPSPVRISEIMYHPVLDTAAVEEHEFVELANPSDAAADLTGFELAGGIRYAFAKGTSIPARGFLVVAKRKARLVALKRYQLAPEAVVGDYAGALGNDGDTVRLERKSGGAVTVVDEVKYDDAFPWPLAADALGAGDAWLPPELLPLEDHRHLGRSLERRSLTDPGDHPSNWQASPLDGATPGRASASAGAPLATVMSVATAAGDKTSAILPPGAPIAVRVSLVPDTATAPEIEWFVDDLAREDEPRMRAPLQPGAGGRVAMLPEQPPQTLLRYRVWGDRGRGPEIISPRPEEPVGYHNAFVGELPEGRTPAYQLLISKERWTELWDNIIDGRVPGNIGGGNPEICEPNPRWDARVPAVLVGGDGVWDVQTRYQGSRVNRFSGPRQLDRMKWPAPGVPPTSIPTHVSQPLSWHFNFPRHARLEGRKTINFSKLPEQSCQGFFARVGNTLFEMVGVPAAQTKYARFYINGSYYHYMQRIEHVDEDMLLRTFGPDHQVGDLFKSVGVRWDEGPFGFGDERILQDFCGYSAAERYDWTYERQTRKDESPGSGIVKDMIEKMHAARAGGVPALRAFFEQHFDVQLLTNYMVVRNWLGAWDDVWQNHYLYRRRDGRWMVLPTDLDNHFGFAPPSSWDASFFAGLDNGRSNYRDLTNYLKDSYFRAFREEYLDRLRALSRDVLHPSNVLPLIDEALADYDLEEARAAPAGVSNTPQCSVGDPAMVAARMKSFVRQRHERVLDGLFD